MLCLGVMVGGTLEPQHLLPEAMSIIPGVGLRASLEKCFRRSVQPSVRALCLEVPEVQCPRLFRQQLKRFLQQGFIRITQATDRFLQCEFAHLYCSSGPAASCGSVFQNLLCAKSRDVSLIKRREPVPLSAPNLHV